MAPVGLEPARLMLTFKCVKICSTPLTTAPRRLDSVNGSRGVHMVHGIPKSKMTSWKADAGKNARFSTTIHNETRYTDNKQNGEHDNENSKFNQPQLRPRPCPTPLKLKNARFSTKIGRPYSVG